MGPLKLYTIYQILNVPFSNFISHVYFPFFLNVPVKEKVTLSLPLPGMVHRRDISTKGAAVCLISPAQMGRQKSLGQPWVY